MSDPTAMSDIDREWEAALTAMWNSPSPETYARALAVSIKQYMTGRIDAAQHHDDVQQINERKAREHE